MGVLNLLRKKDRSSAITNHKNAWGGERPRDYFGELDRIASGIELWTGKRKRLRILKGLKRNAWAEPLPFD